MTARQTFNTEAPARSGALRSQRPPAADDNARPAISDAGAARAQTPHSHWAQLQEVGLSAGLWFLYYCHRLFGRAFYRALTVPISWYYLFTRPVARRASLEYLHRVGELGATSSTWRRMRAVARHIQGFADVLLDKALVWTGGIDLRSVQREVDPRFDAAVARGEGGVLVVAHLGNLELLRVLAGSATERKSRRPINLHILVHTRNAQRFNRVLRRLNPHVDDDLLQVTDVDAVAAVNLAADVERGHFIVIAADRVPVTSERVLPVPFFGRPAPLPVGPWVLASALRCPVFWLTCFKDRADRYTLVCEQISARVELPRATRSAALTAIMTRYAQRLEQGCRRAPYAWFNFYPFWAASSPATSTAASNAGPAASHVASAPVARESTRESTPTQGRGAASTHS